MNTLRLSTVALTLAIAVVALGYVNPSFAGKDKECPAHPSCKPDDPEPPAGGIEYSATLTGAFAFTDVDVTSDAKGIVLKSADNITITRPGGTVMPTEVICATATATDTDTDLLCKLWNSVFEQCLNFFGPTIVDVPSFEAPSERKGWTIDKPGGVRVNFRSIPFIVPVNGEVEVTLVLIGTTDYDKPFLPADPDDSENPTMIKHELSSFWIYGKSGRGAPDKHCQDGSDEGIGLLLPNSSLTITATLALTPP